VRLDDEPIGGDNQRTVGIKIHLSTLGRPVDPDDAKISVFDRGFLYGDSVYETMRTSGGHPVELSRHLARLHRSGEGIGLPIPFGDDALRTIIAETHAATTNPESHVRVVVTRGVGPLMLDPRKSEDPTLVVIAQPLVVPEEAAYQRGIAVVIVGTTKTGGGLDPAIKSGNYLGSILALRRALAEGGDDAVLCSHEGDIAEGVTSNVFAVIDGRLRTPDLEVGLLAGITREVVCELAAELGDTVHTGKIWPDELRRADEVFLTSSVRGIMPVTKVDGRVIGSGREGPITGRLRERYAAYLTAWSTGARGDA
jgi:branched-chain amino acid aminotransferase